MYRPKTATRLFNETTKRMNYVSSICSVDGFLNAQLPLSINFFATEIKRSVKAAVILFSVDVHAFVCVGHCGNGFLRYKATVNVCTQRELELIT
jgi:hypothetical protein